MKRAGVALRGLFLSCLGAGDVRLRLSPSLEVGSSAPLLMATQVLQF